MVWVAISFSRASSQPRNRTQVSYIGRQILYYWATRVAAAKSLQLCPTVWPHRWQPTRLLRPGDFPGKSTGVGAIAFFGDTRVSLGNCCCSVTQSCLIVCSPMGCNPPGSSVNGIFQARILEWVAISNSRWSSQPRDQTHVSYISCISRQILYHCVTREAPGDNRALN